MKKLLKALAVLAVLVVAVFAGLAVFVSTLDADKYRPKLVDAINKQTGREAKLDGPISFSLGLGDVHVSVQNASISNPAWASRPVMASMGKFELAVGLLPLLSHRLSVDKLVIENADILLESNAAGQHNWDFGTAVKSGAAQPAAAPVETASSSGSRQSLSIGKLSIVNSQLAMRGADGKISGVNVASLDLNMGGIGAELKFDGDFNGAPITLDVKTGITDLLSKSAFSFDADATYDALHLKAQGNVDSGGGNAEISAYQLTAGKTTIKGDASATWNGARPTLRGTLSSDDIDPADFKLTAAPVSTSEAPVNTNAQQAAPSSVKRMFSDVPLPLAGLKAVDADLAVSVGSLKLGNDALKQISAKLALKDGNLVLAPVKANVGASPVDLQVKLDAAQSPAQLTIGVIGNGVDLGDLQKLGGMAPFMTGSAGANIQLTGQGNSMHDIASSLGGVIVVTAEKGQILTGAAAHISSLLGALFSGGGGDSALNCLAARFIAKNGVLNDNGILIDSAASVVSGKGNVNLGSEMVDMDMHAKTKLVDIGGLVPTVQISGSLSSPHYSVDTASVVKNVVGSLVNGNIDVVGSSVPDIQTAPAGQNACVYTLDHPKAASSTGILPADTVGKASQQIKNIGNSVLKGLFGK